MEKEILDEKYLRSGEDKSLRMKEKYWIELMAVVGLNSMKERNRELITSWMGLITMWLKFFDEFKIFEA